MDQTGLRRPYPLDRERKRRVMVELARRDMTISDLAMRLGCNRGNLSSCISGRLIHCPLEKRIASYLALPAEYLFPVRTAEQLRAMQKEEMRSKSQPVQSEGAA